MGFFGTTTGVIAAAYLAGCTAGGRASACTAVGSTQVAALAERWNGNTWTIQHLPG